jgi:hypothetical protein
MLLTLTASAEIWTDTPVRQGRLDPNQVDSKGPKILFVSFYVLISEAQSLISELDLQDGITDLRKALYDTLLFIEDADPIKTWKDPALKNQQTVLSRLVLQILGCCRFLDDFSKKTQGDSFGERDT